MADSDGECDWSGCPQLKKYESYCVRAKATEVEE